MLRSVAGITGSPTPEIVAEVRSTIPKSFVPVRNDRSRSRFPTVMFSKNIHMFLWASIHYLPKLYDCSLLEMLRQRAFLIKSAASHVESDSHCERTDCVSTSKFGMYAEMTLMRPNVSFHVYIAAHFLFIED